jgi:hypothetical protein
VVVAAILLIYITPSPAERAAWQVQELEADSNTVFAAALSYVQDLGYAIDAIDKDSGFIMTQYASRGQLHGGWGVLADILAGEARYAVTIQVSALSTGRTRVRVNLIAEEWNEGSSFQTGHWSQDPLAYGEGDYLAFFSGLRSVLGLGGLSFDAGEVLIPALG